jgi:hypothetical protein
MILSRRDDSFSEGTFVAFRATWATIGLILAFAASLGAPARADGGDPSYLVFGVGYFDINRRDDEAVDFRLEYRHGEKFWIFKPWAGIEATSDGAFYGAVGVLVDFDISERVVFTPSFGVGYYEEGSGKDLGHEIEFRSQIELSYRLDNRARLGLALSHISNASLGDDNPGVEILNVYYALPLDSLLD